jgi:hypothetical protein
MPYTETVTRDGESVTTTVSDAHALTALCRGRRLGATAAAAKDGTVTITRTRLVFGEADGEVLERVTVVTLRPTAKQPRLSRTQYEDLERIRRAQGRAELGRDGRIRAAMWAIPAGPATRLIERALAVISEADGRVLVGVAGLLALAAYEHPVRTTTPLGWHYPENGPTPNRMPTWKQSRRHPYQIPEFSSSAVCPCGLYAAHDRREGARRTATRHLEEKLTAALAGAHEPVSAPAGTLIP